MAAIQYIFNAVIQLYILLIFIMVVMSWLLSFNVINRGNQFVDAIWRTSMTFTEPVLSRVRSLLPNMGGIDISPIVLLIGLNALQIFVNKYVFAPLLNQGL